jgi:hypothetical protein
VTRGGGQHAVRRQAQIQILPSQQPIHERDDLEKDTV